MVKIFYIFIFRSKGNQSIHNDMKEKLQNPILNKDEEEEYLGFTLSQLRLNGGLHTAKEICQQPQLWSKIHDLVLSHHLQVQSFLDKAYAHNDLEIILTGAGTSAFIGNTLQGPFQKNSGKRTRALATTDLVSHPQQYFIPDAATLLVSFARSGNSPESIAAIHLANKICRKVFHLIITCNPSGKLTSDPDYDSSFILILPKECNDQSLAMTSSFTCMLLAGILLSRIREINELKPQVEQLVRYGKYLLDNYIPTFSNVAKINFDRAVFLGSGPLNGAARESQLKLQELTDGKVICKYDSFLGFRHGPKVVINPSTLLVYLFTNNSYAHQYEVDLVKAVNDGDKGIFRIGISEAAEKGLDVDLLITFSNSSVKIEEEFLSICSVMPAQIIGFFKSLHLGLKPDSPSVNGSITRVVQGVTIYQHVLKPEIKEKE